MSSRALAISAAVACLLIPSFGQTIAVVAVPGVDVGRVAPHLRPEIVDRNGVVLAATTTAPSLFANPMHIDGVRRTAARLAAMVPGTDLSTLQSRLASRSQFVWVARWVPEDVAELVARARLRGVGMRREIIRRYPLGTAASHLVGFTDLDSGDGRAGVEAYLDTASPADGKAVQLTIDARVQRAVSAELHSALTTYRAQGAAAIVLDARSAQVLGLVSLPDFDPNDHRTIQGDAYRNKITANAYEMGGVFEMFVTALALERHQLSPRTLLDVVHPLRVGSTILRDDEPSSRPLSVEDAFARSSVIGAARIAETIPASAMLEFLRRAGLLDPMRIETGDAFPSPFPQPDHWIPLTHMTVGYGYGLAVTPLQAAAAATALVNGGLMRRPTLLLRSQTATPTRVVSERTSETLRHLLRYAVLHGTGIQADVPGFSVGGKTGTSEPLLQGVYAHGRRQTWFFCAFPLNGMRRYSLLIMLDAPQNVPDPSSPATAEWNAAPTARRVIMRIAPFLDLGN